MEIRISGKRDDSPGYKSLSAWVRKTNDGKKVLIFNLGELQISMYPFDSYLVKELGITLQKIVDT